MVWTLLGYTPGAFPRTEVFELPTVHRTEVAGSLGELRIPVVSLLCLAGFLGAAGWTLSRRRRAKPLRLPLAVAALCLATAAAAYPFAQVTLNRPELIAGELDDERATALLETLLKNVYRAFDFREEEDVYDKLALSVSGDLLTDIYLQNRRSLAIQQAGGAQAKVTQVQVEKAEINQTVKSANTITVRSAWWALGTVGHWGHMHTRRNVYDAELTLAVVDGKWKITGIDVLEEKRVDPFAQQGSGA